MPRTRHASSPHLITTTRPRRDAEPPRHYLRDAGCQPRKYMPPSRRLTPPSPTPISPVHAAEHLSLLSMPTTTVIDAIAHRFNIISATLTPAKMKSRWRLCYIVYARLRHARAMPLALKAHLRLFCRSCYAMLSLVWRHACAAIAAMPPHAIRHTGGVCRIVWLLITRHGRRQLLACHSQSDTNTVVRRQHVTGRRTAHDITVIFHGFMHNSQPLMNGDACRENIIT